MSVAATVECIDPGDSPPIKDDGYGGTEASNIYLLQNKSRLLSPNEPALI